MGSCSSGRLRTKQSFPHLRAASDPTIGSPCTAFEFRARCFPVVAVKPVSPCQASGGGRASALVWRARRHLGGARSASHRRGLTLVRWPNAGTLRRARTKLGALRSEPHPRQDRPPEGPLGADRGVAEHRRDRKTLQLVETGALVDLAGRARLRQMAGLEAHQRDLVLAGASRRTQNEEQSDRKAPVGRPRLGDPINVLPSGPCLRRGVRSPGAERDRSIVTRRQLRSHPPRRDRLPRWMSGCSSMTRSQKR